MTALVPTIFREHNTRKVAMVERQVIRYNWIWESESKSTNSMCSICQRHIEASDRKLGGAGVLMSWDWKKRF